MIVLVCGGRDYNDYKFVEQTLNQIADHITLLVNGDALGADSMADSWAVDHGIQVARCPANWDFYQKGAGPVRNRAMMLIQPHLVIAFPGGKGTADMTRVADNAGVPVWFPVACPDYTSFVNAATTLEQFLQ
jgi:hypothetical protein